MKLIISNHSIDTQSILLIEEKDKVSKLYLFIENNNVWYKWKYKGDKILKYEKVKIK